MKLRTVIPRLYQGSLDPLEGKAALPSDVNAVLAVGNSCIRLDGMFTRHIPLIEISTEYPDKLKRQDFWARKSSDEEIIAAIEALRRLYDGGWTIYLHCDAGVCRSVGVVAAFLVRAGHAETLDAAYEIVTGNARYCSPEQNTFENAIDRLVKGEYWKQFDRYFDILNSFYTWDEWRAMQLKDAA